MYREHPEDPSEKAAPGIDRQARTPTQGRSLNGNIRPFAPAPDAVPAPAGRVIATPTQLDKPAFLVNFPFSHDVAVANNVWMTELSGEDRRVDRTKAMAQFMQLYTYLASDSLVYVLPTPVGCRLQDLVFTANLGIVLEHIEDRHLAVISNFSSEPRRGETLVGEQFFRAMGYETVVPTTKFEGEAELKHLYDNVYVGGYGERSEADTYAWMEAEFGMKIVRLAEVDPYLYHLDCTVFPVTLEDTVIATEMYEQEEIAELEKYTNIIDVPADTCFAGLCNSVRLHNTILNSSHIHDLKAGCDEYTEELAKNRMLEDIAVSLGMEVTYFNLSEYHKSGALLSCMVMHLNRRSYAFSLM